MQRSHVDHFLSSYQHIGNTLSTYAKLPHDTHTALRWFLLDSPVVPYLLAFHTLFAALSIYKLTQGKQFWLKSLVLTTFAAFGGSTLAAVFSGSPAPLFTVSSNYMLGYMIVAWYLVNNVALFRYILMLRPVTAVLAFGAMAAKARSIMSFMEGYCEKFPGQTMGAIVLSGLSGSGGALFVTLEKMVQGGMGVKSELSSPGWGVKSAFLAAGFYYFCGGLEGDGWDREEVRFSISLALCVHAGVESLWGRHINVLWAFEEVLASITRVERGEKEKEE